MQHRWLCCCSSALPRFAAANGALFLASLAFQLSLTSLSTPVSLAVWCWGWDGAGDLEGPDVEPVWEQMPNQTIDPIVVRHDRSFTAT
ncbi:hypothetical protein OF846_002684 [Rhodotorula toruloides]|nr:hypothetical protein OF846_002684 [Rhodotorula toruloides]